MEVFLLFFFFFSEVEQVSGTMDGGGRDNWGGVQFGFGKIGG